MLREKADAADEALRSPTLRHDARVICCQRCVHVFDPKELRAQRSCVKRLHVLSALADLYNLSTPAQLN